MNPSKEYLFDLAKSVLNLTVSIFAGEGVALPDRRYVSNGLVAFDCAQLAVETVRTFVGFPEQETSTRIEHCPTPLSADLMIYLIRDCAPGSDSRGHPPHDTAIEASAKIVLEDGWILWNGWRAAIKSNESCRAFELGNLTGVGPEGNHVGWKMALRIGLNN